MTSVASKLLADNSPMQLRDLISKVRKAKTAAEERALIKKESAYLRTVLDKNLDRYTARNLVKLMYIHMLGYSSEFGQVPCLALITKGSFADKRVGYLALMLLLDESHETLMMVTNSMKNDLASSDEWIVLNALTALGNICSPGMALDLATDVEILSNKQHLERRGIGGPMAAHIRKKALLAACRMLSRKPDLAEVFKDAAAAGLTDRNHAVVLASVTLMIQVLESAEGSDIKAEYATRYVRTLCSILDQLHGSRRNSEYDVNAVNDPFLQVKVLKCLGKLGVNDGESTNLMTDTLAKVAAARAIPPPRNDRLASTTAAALGYQCAQTILEIEPVRMLRTHAISIMGTFLQYRDNNMRYVALNTLVRTAASDLATVQRHRGLIVECVKDADVTIRRRALDLVYALVNGGNVEALVRELVAYLEVTDEAFKSSLSEHLTTIVEKHAPDTRWYIDTVLQIMAVARKYVKDAVARAFIVRVSNAPEALQAYAVRQALSLASIKQQIGADALMCTCMWLLGEYGDLLNGAYAALPDEGAWDAHSGATDSLLSTLEALTEAHICAEVQAYSVMAAMKLIARLPHAQPRLQKLVDRYRTSRDVELQQRSCEIDSIIRFHGRLPAIYAERIPPLDEQAYAGNLRHGVPALQAAAAAASPAATADLLGDFDSLITSQPDVPEATAVRSVLDDLDDLLAGPAPTALPTAHVAGLPDGLDDLLGAAAPAALVPETPGQKPIRHPAFLAWNSNEDGISITFTCVQTMPGTVEIDALYQNNGAATVQDFRVQAAVPKNMVVTMFLQEGGAELLPQSRNELRQRMQCSNRTDGAKPLAMRLKVSYKVNGDQREHFGVVSQFPAGL